MSDQEIYESLLTGKRMHNGQFGNDSANNITYTSSSSQQQYLDEFAMDVFALDFNGQGAALHSSKLLRQAEFFARAVETIVAGCNISNNTLSSGGITIVAHSIGAWVVRVALKMHPHLSANWIRNVVTLASPLSSVPYAVDIGVHDIATHINDAGYDEGDVTMISVSGGLRDEMIPPEVCQVLPSSTHDDRNGFKSNAYLSTHAIMKRDGSSIENEQFGMDHRAIVWCYDVLKVVREVIFSLVVATEQGLSSTERMNVAHKIMHKDKAASNLTENMHQDFNKHVIDQHARLMQKGYTRIVSIQLSAPYNLNLLLKLSIVAALLHTFVVGPAMCYLYNVDSLCETLSEKCENLALSLIVIPTLVTMLRACQHHEYQLLLGSIFILSQIATLLYFIIVHGVCAIVALLCARCAIKYKQKSSIVDKATTSSQSSLCVIYVRTCISELLLFTLIALPLTTSICYTINIFINDNDDIAWNRTAMASYSFISFALLIYVQLIILACKSSAVRSERQKSELFVLLLSLLKATYGKVLYAFSLTTVWGQSDLGSYDNFLTAVNSNVGMIRGHHNEMTTCAITSMLPVFLVQVAIRTHDKMTNMGTTGSGSNMVTLKETLNMRYNEPKFITVARACLICWFTWNAFANFTADNSIVPIFSLTVAITTYLKCHLHSKEFMDVCSAIINKDLSLESSYNKDK